MRLRRLEWAILIITLAFIMFTGGFLTGRNTGSAGYTAVTQQNGNLPETDRPGAQGSPPAVTAGSTAGVPDAQGSSTPSGGSGAGTQSPDIPHIRDSRININTATHGELTDLPGIGNVIASRIIDYRTQHGYFKSIEEIKNVSGIGDRKFEAIMELITVG